MAAGSIPIYIGASRFAPVELNGAVIDLSGLPRRVLKSPAKLKAVLAEIAAMSEDELVQRQQACLNFMDQRYENCADWTHFSKHLMP